MDQVYNVTRPGRPSLTCWRARRSQVWDCRSQPARSLCPPWRAFVHGGVNKDTYISTWHCWLCLKSLCFSELLLVCLFVAWVVCCFKLLICDHSFNFHSPPTVVTVTRDHFNEHSGGVVWAEWTFKGWPQINKTGAWQRKELPYGQAKLVHVQSTLLGQTEHTQAAELEAYWATRILLFCNLLQWRSLPWWRVQRGWRERGWGSKAQQCEACLRFDRFYNRDAYK